jgi:single-stranded DNA-binding protein
MSEAYWNTKVYLQSASVWKNNGKKEISGGMSVTSLVVSIYQGKNKDGSYKDSLFMGVDFWGELAALVENAQKKDKLYVEGELKLRSWVDKQSGEKRSVPYIRATSVQFV